MIGWPQKLESHRETRIRAAALALALAAVLPGATVADSRQTGLIDGRVVDAAGAALSRVTVKLTGDRGEQSTATDADGRYLFGPLTAGSYVATVELAGFTSFERTVRLETGERATLDFRLGLDTADRIDVVASPPLIRTEPGASSTLEAEVVAELVFATRNHQSVVASLPGVVYNAQNSSELTPSVNGALWQENAAFVDGVDVTDSRYGGGSRVLFPASALAEVRSDASGYGAEYGRVVGGVTEAVTKSGTNDFHGDFLLVAQNPAWRAQSDIVAADREDRLISSFETSLGGPFLRDRVWFFAAAGETTNNLLSPLAGGEVIDSSLESESLIVKVSADVSHRHAVNVSAIDSSIGSALFMPFTAEPYSVADVSRGVEFFVVGWTWVVAEARFVEARASRQRSHSERTSFAVTTIAPGAGPDDPAGNRGTYWDNASGLHWHGSDLPIGPGSLDFPRDQANAAFTWLKGVNELEIGADYQDIGWEALNRPPDRYLGRGYDQDLPGGFAAPELKRVFLPIDSAVGTPSTNLALYARDRFDLGDRWTVTAGLRVEQQAHEDDRGREVLASTDLAPRASAVYDVGAAGKLLIKATAGRYVSHIPQDFINQEFASLPNGANAFDEYRWNPATGRYDLFNRRQLPSMRAPVEQIEPYRKDELTAGVAWQINQSWALDARAIAWRIDAPWSATDQFDERGGIYRLLANFEEAEREYRGLQVELNRAFRDGLVVRANYTLSRVEGNSSGYTDFDSTAEDFLEARAVLDPATGLPVTALYRHGRLPQDRTHILNLSGAKRWQVGAGHSLAVGGWFGLRSGQPWGLRPAVALRQPGSAATILTTRYAEPRDANELPDTHTLDVTAAWEFPLVQRVSGSLRVELVNAGDEQEQIAVTLETGRPIEVPQSYQTPRELRLVAGVRF